MRNGSKAFLCAVCCLSAVTTSAAEMGLSLDVPACKMPPGKPLPAKYYAIAKKWKEYRWVLKVRPGAKVVSRSGDERVDGSRMYDWYTFVKMDINGDGLCDWFLTSLAPYSTGGDSGVLNTLYLSTSSGWKRIGAKIPENKPDGLGWGSASAQQAEFAYSSDAPLVVWDQKGKIPHLIGWFDRRHDSGRPDQEGYHVYRWNNAKNTLEELDKWVPGSDAAQVYAFFKQHGAVDVIETGTARIKEFDLEIEEAEFDRGCKSEEILKRSPHFARLCKKPALRPPAPSPDKSPTPVPQPAQAASGFQEVQAASSTRISM